MDYSTYDEDAALMAALEESAAMHQASIDSEICSKSFEEFTADGQMLHQIPIFNQFHPRWNTLISRYEAASAICGYTATACACVMARAAQVQQDGTTLLQTREQVQKFLCEFAVVDPMVEDVMSFVAHRRRTYVISHKSDFPDSNSIKDYMRAWVANYEISDYLRARDDDLKPYLLNLRYNQFSELAVATHEEKIRILTDEAAFEGTTVLVETFLPTMRSDGPQLHRPDRLLASPIISDNKWTAAVIDASGHFVVAVRCADGCAVFNTTDISYLHASAAGPTTALAFKLMNI